MGPTSAAQRQARDEPPDTTGELAKIPLPPLVGYLARRLVWAIASMAVVVVITFVLTRVVPGDPASFLAGFNASKAQIARLQHEMGLDQPLPAQFLHYVSGLFHLSLGDSVRTGRPVLSDLRMYLPATLELIVYSFIAYLVISIVLGVVAARSRRRYVDATLRALSSLGSGIPVFWLALLLQEFFYGAWHVLPLSGRLDTTTAPPAHVTGFFTIDSLIAGNIPLFKESVEHLILPIVAIVLAQLGVGLRMMRESVIDELQTNYVRTARAKAISERRILLRHVLRNSLSPFVTTSALQLGFLFGWILLIEVVFQWPGIGLYAYQSFTTNDYNPIMGLTLLVSAIFILVNLLADLIYPLLDPRLREE